MMAIVAAVVAILGAHAHNEPRLAALGVLGEGRRERVVEYALSASGFHIMNEGRFPDPSRLIVALVPLRGGWMAVERMPAKASRTGTPSLSVVRFDGRGGLLGVTERSLPGVASLCPGFAGSVLFECRPEGPASYRVSGGGRLASVASLRLRKAGFYPAPEIDPASRYLTVESESSPTGNRVGFVSEYSVRVLPGGAFGPVTVGLPGGKVTDGPWGYASYVIDARGAVTGVRCYRTLASGVSGQGAVTFSLGDAGACTVDPKGSRVFFAERAGSALYWRPLRAGTKSRRFFSLAPLSVVQLRLSLDGAYLSALATAPKGGLARLEVFRLGTVGPPTPVAAGIVPEGVLWPSGLQLWQVDRP